MIARVRHLNMLTSIQLLTLKEQIPILDTERYYNYIKKWLPSDEIAIFCKWDDDGTMRGYIHVESPHELWPERGWVMAAVFDNLKKKESLGLLQAAEEWLKEKGAKYWEMETLRQSKAWGRTFGLEETGHTYGRRMP
jgi:hypothetical protein